MEHGICAQRELANFSPIPEDVPANRDEVLMMVADTNHGQR